MTRQEAWDVYFATVVGMSVHPGYQREGTDQFTLAQCANLADRMLEYRDERHIMLKEHLWPSGPQE